jgi:hypothetical protein
MDLNIPKCAITGAPNKSKMTPETFKAYIQMHKITYNNKPIPILHQNKPYKYLSIQLIPSQKMEPTKANHHRQTNKPKPKFC